MGQSGNVLGRNWLFREHDPGGLDGFQIVHRRIHRRRSAVEVHHDVNIGPDSVAQRADHGRDGIDRFVGRHVVRIGNADDLDGVIASLGDDAPALDDRGDGIGLVHGLHVAKAEMGVGAQIVAHLAAEQAPDRDAKRLAENVPERDLDSADRGHALDPETPEAVPRQDLVALLDIAGILPDQQRLEILDGADHGPRLPFQRGFAPAKKPGLVRLDRTKTQLRISALQTCVADGRDLHQSSRYVVFCDIMYDLFRILCASQ